MKENRTAALDPVVRRFVEDAGNTTQSFGLGRVIGQIYAYLYFSRAPRSLADLQDALGISKGSASTGVRQLEQWAAVRKVWVKGDRKDYYEANDWLGRILRNAALDMVGKKVQSYGSLLAEMERQLRTDGNGEAAFVRERVRQLQSFQSRAQDVLNSPIVKSLLR